MAGPATRLALTGSRRAAPPASRAHVTRGCRTRSRAAAGRPVAAGRAVTATEPGDGGRHRIRQVARVYEHPPGKIADPRPQRGQQPDGVPPGGRLVTAEPLADPRPEPPRVAAVITPGGQ